MVAKTYICNHCQLITEPITYQPTCPKCGKEMIEGDDGIVMEMVKFPKSELLELL